MTVSRSSLVSIAISAAGLASFGLWQVHWIFGAALFAVCWHLLIVRPREALEDALSLAIRREWSLGARVLRNLGWRTRSPASPDVHTPDHRWWYRSGAGEIEAVVDFDAMTMSLTTEAATFRYELRPNEADEPQIECRLLSKERKDGAVETIDGQAWSLDCPDGIDIAYHVHVRLRTGGRKR